MTNKIGLGGGCHWCTEGIFQSLIGVEHVDQGWIKSEGENDAFSEAVIVTYDPNEISLETLIEIHILTHSSTSEHSMRGKYRSAVYIFDEKQGEDTQMILDRLNTARKEKMITQVLPFVDFKRNTEDLLNYYQTRPDAPFCKRYIEPKLRKLLETHGKQINLNYSANKRSTSTFKSGSSL